MKAFQFLNNPAPVFANPEAMNPALPFPDWQATGVPLPQTVPPPSAIWNQKLDNPFPPRSLVPQPRRMTVIA